MDIDKLIVGFKWRGKRPRIVNTILKEKEQQSWRTNTIQLQDLLWSYSYQASGGIGEILTKRSMEQNTEPQNTPQ